jgi:hypothetical protein
VEIDPRQPPRWSPNNQSLAFVTRQADGRGDAAELYVVPRQGGAVYAVPSPGRRIQEFAWLDDATLAIVDLKRSGQPEAEALEWATGVTRKIAPKKP